jgi:hypothetical protein
MRDESESSDPLHHGGGGEENECMRGELKRGGVSRADRWLQLGLTSVDVGNLKVGGRLAGRRKTHTQ